MNLSISKQRELEDAYDTLIQVCLYDRPLEDMAPLLADDVMNFGAGRKEITKTKEAFLDQIRGQKELAAGLTMNFTFNPVLRKTINDGNGAIYTDDIINTVWINDVETQLKFRLSFIFEFRDNKWLLVHSHTSAPDSQRTDDEVWPVEELKKRTAVLEKSLDEKIAELEIKNRELQIDSALERTRAQSMLMQHSDQLDDTLRIFHEQILLLGINSAFSFLWLPDESNDRHIFWAAWAENSSNNPDKNSIVLKSKAIDYPLNRNEPATAQCLIDWKGKESVVSYHVPPEGVDAYFDAWQELIAGVEKLKPEYFSNGLYYVEAFIKYGCFGVMVKDELSAEEKKILLRFAVEFERTYTRFLGLQEAEANAREARIEVSLERIRSRAMAMRNTEELLDAADLVGKELAALGIESMNVSYAFVAEDQQSASYYSVNPLDGKILPFPFVFPHTETEVMRSILRSWKNQEPLNIQELDEEDTLNHQSWIGQHIRNLFEKKGIAFSIEEFLKISPKKAVISTFNFTYGYLFSIGSVLLSEQQKDIFLRVTKVFDLTYRRFLDLQQAEAQAREAQIQLALERVRARTMAMQKSEELPEAANVLFQQMQSLGVPAWSAGYCIWDKDKQGITLWMSSEGVMQPCAHAPLTEDPSFIHMKEAYERGDDFHVEEVGGEALVSHYQYMRTLPVVGEILDSIISAGHPLPVFQIFHCVYFDHGFLLFITYEPVTEVHDVFKRFGSVFDQTYTRFLDLQKAEAQAREAEIELALERVRARTMAMQKSDELKEVIKVVFEQFVHLHFHIEHAGFVINYTPKGDWNFWVADQHAVPSEVCVPYFDSVWGKGFIEAKEKNLDFFATLLDFEEKNKFYRELLGFIPGLPEETTEFYFSCPGLAVSTVVFDNVSLYIENFSGVPYSDEENLTLMRFGKVFQQTYTRFLDLKQAESQARESQIQLALERVRAKTMAMQKSEELGECSFELVKQVQSLGIATWHCAFSIYDEDQESSTEWGSNEWGTYPKYKTPRVGIFKTYYDLGQKGETFHVEVIGKDRCADHYAWLSTLPGVGDELVKLRDAGVPFPTSQIDHVAYFKYGYLIFITYDPAPEAHEVFIRFAKVFEQTYTRFLDLKNSEAQAREAKIETALERVRSRTMAMQKSSELADVAVLLFNQVSEMGIKTWTTGFNVWSDDNNSYLDYITSPSGQLIDPYNVDTTSAAALMEIADARKSGNEFVVLYVDGEKITELYKALTASAHLQFEKMLEDGIRFPSHQYEHFVFGNKVSLMFITHEPVPEAHHIFRRLGKVFEQTYTRFLDLQKAESQARESQIEAALERVRSRTMAMQRSEELQDAAVLLFQQIRALDVQPFACGFNIWDEDGKAATAWMTQENVLMPPFKYSTSEDVFLYIHEASQRGDSLFVKEQSGEELDIHYRYMASLPVFGDTLQQMAGMGLSVPSFQIIHCAFFAQGYLMFITYDPVPEAYDIFKRFAKVFEQTYTRFLDLQKSEALAMETIKRASVDRVRAEIASMRSTSDLDRITPLIWNELTTLGVPFIRCGVFIMDEQEEQVHTFLSTPDGNALAAFHQSFNAPGEIADIVKSWQKNEMYRNHWDEARFNEFTKSLVEQGAITSGEKYITENHPTDLYLHFLPFLQGMLYVGNTSALNNDELQLVQNLADAFSTAYARYEDFNKLETAKEQVDRTLTDLKQAQSQLVQAEKMASLGELTAGIAHEIQNPLNFVNNFSEVNAELSDEIMEAAINGNLEEIKLLAADIKSNQQKIREHGKRADSIVKGMLQHSRTNSGESLPTDINALADEYLRLAYHGLRAKDKSFNATIRNRFRPKYW